MTTAAAVRPARTMIGGVAMAVMMLPSQPASVPTTKTRMPMPIGTSRPETEDGARRRARGTPSSRRDDPVTVARRDAPLRDEAPSTIRQARTPGSPVAGSASVSASETRMYSASG